MTIPTGRLIGIYALVSPGACAREHTVVMELNRSSLIGIVAGDEEEGIREICRYVDSSTVHLVELGGGWTHHGVGRLTDAVGEKTIVTARWFPDGDLPARPDGVIRRASVFFCSTPGMSAVIETPRERVSLVGILDPEDGIQTCVRLVRDEGVQVIEICSDWGFRGAASVQAAVGDDVRVGASLHQAVDCRRRAEHLYVPPEFHSSAGVRPRG